MADVAKVIEVLRRRQMESARAVLLTPPGKEAFDFGVASGTFKAYEQMLEDINELLEDEKRDEKRRESNK
jgi:hypothetical protein